MLTRNWVIEPHHHWVTKPKLNSMKTNVLQRSDEATSFSSRITLYLHFAYFPLQEVHTLYPVNMIIYRNHYK